MLRTRMMLSALAAAAVLSTSAFAGVGATIYNAPVASAQTQVGIPETGTLNIHKIVGPATDVRATGEEMDVAGTPASGVNFNVYQVNNIDLTTQGGWTAAAALDIDSLFTGPVKSVATVDPGQVTLPQNGTVTTGPGGTATFTGDAGVYLVVEQSGQTHNDQALAPSEPFLVTLPMTNQEGNAWLDVVHVYPKNQVVTGAEKTVFDPGIAVETDQTGSALNERIGYNITAEIPLSGANGLRFFAFTDKLPAELGTVNNDNIVVSIGETDLLEEDYSVNTWTLGEGAQAQQVLYVTLTSEGLAKATAAANNATEETPATITLSFDAEVTAVPGADTTLNNQAWTSVTDPGLTGNWDPEIDSPGVETNSARSIYGQINITKTGTDEEGNSVNLPGAIFQLHRCTIGENNAAILVEGSEPIRVGNATDFTTANGTEGTLGQVSISGIHLANVSDQDAGTLEYLWDDGNEFCLVETQAPTGYSLLPAPVQVTFPEYDETTNTLVVAAQDVPNVSTDAGFTLPLTGGNGFWLIVGAGVVLLVVAGGYYVIARNRSESAN